MTNKKWKILWLSGLLTLALGVYNALFGNPFSKVLATTTATHYLEATYPTMPFTLDARAYDVKKGGYEFLVTVEGEQYPLVINGFWGNKIKRDSIYEARLDQPLMKQLGQQASEQITSWLAYDAKVEVYIEVTKGDYAEDVTWSPAFQANHPLVAFITAETPMTAQQFETNAEQTKQILNSKRVVYEYITLTAKGENGDVMYTTGFSPNDQTIKVKTFES